MKKRILSLILIFVLLCAYVPCSAAAENSTPVGVAVAPVSISGENEFFSAPADEASALTASQENLTYHAVYEDVVAEIRQNMTARNTEFVVGYETDHALTMDHLIAFYQAALAETDSSQEGDYLHYHIGSYKVGAPGVTDYTTYWYDLTFSLVYYTTAEQEAAVTDAVKTVLDTLGVSSMKTEYEKVDAIYQYITENVAYYDGNIEKDEDYIIFTTYGALINHEAVCQGYASLFYRLLREAGIGCRVITGTSYGVNHAWNIVEVDGKYYAADSTWDASLQTWGYFLRCHTNMDHHTLDESYTQEPFASLYRVSLSDYILRSGDCGANGEELQWNVSSTGVLSITGTGSMAEYSDSRAPWHCYLDEIKSVQISAGTQSVGAGAFSDCENLVSVALPADVAAIGADAFADCGKLHALCFAGTKTQWDGMTENGAKDLIVFSEASPTFTHEEMTLAGDFNCDGTVNSIDRMLLARMIDAWNSCANFSDTLANADLNGDGAVNAADYDYFCSNLAGISNYALPTL